MPSAAVSRSSGHVSVRVGRKALDPLAGLALLLPGLFSRVSSFWLVGTLTSSIPMSVLRIMLFTVPGSWSLPSSWRLRPARAHGVWLKTPENHCSDLWSSCFWGAPFSPELCTAKPGASAFRAPVSAPQLTVMTVPCLGCPRGLESAPGQKVSVLIGHTSLASLPWEITVWATCCPVF